MGGLHEAEILLDEEESVKLFVVFLYFSTNVVQAFLF